jgi:hypothetical protein
MFDRRARHEYWSYSDVNVPSRTLLIRSFTLNAGSSYFALYYFKQSPYYRTSVKL